MWDVEYNIQMKTKNVIIGLIISISLIFVIYIFGPDSRYNIYHDVKVGDTEQQVVQTLTENTIKFKKQDWRDDAILYSFMTRTASFFHGHYFWIIVKDGKVIRKHMDNA